MTWECLLEKSLMTLLIKEILGFIALHGDLSHVTKGVMNKINLHQKKMVNCSRFDSSSILQHVNVLSKEFIHQYTYSSLINSSNPSHQNTKVYHGSHVYHCIQ